MDDFPDSELHKDITKEQVEEPPKDVAEPKEINFMEMLNNPIAKELLGGCKDLFKKREVDPNVCEITIKAPSEVVLKLFGIQ